MKTYLVTGGAGFIGSNFVLHMLEAYEEIKIINIDKLTYAGNLDNLESVADDVRHVFVQGDICDKAHMESLLEQYSPDFIVNFAAESHVDRSIETPELFVQTNVIGTLTLLNAARSFWQRCDGGFRDRKFVQISTDEVYGSLPLEDLELLFTEQTPLCPHSPYSASKASADMLVSAYGTTYGLPINITRCSNNYGPFQFPEKLIPLMITNALEHKSLPVYGDGLNIRDWLYVEDHCRAIDAVISGGILGEVYNIGGNNERSNNDIVKTITNYIGTHVDDLVTEELIEYVEDRLGHDRRYGIDPKKIKAELDWTPTTCFEDGITKTIAWYLDNSEWVDRVASGEYQR